MSTTGLRGTTEQKNLFDSVEDIGFAIFVSVGTNTQVNLAWVFVGFESLGNT